MNVARQRQFSKAGLSRDKKWSSDVKEHYARPLRGEECVSGSGATGAVALPEDEYFFQEEKAGRR